MAYLELKTAPVGIRFPLRYGRNVVGRSHDADVSLAEPSLSRKHAEIVVQGRNVTVCDLGSRNGTFLRGTPVRGVATAADGDALRCGEVVFILRLEASTLEVVPESVADPAAQVSRTVILDHQARDAGDPLAQRLAILLRVGELLARPGIRGDLEGRILDLAMEILPINRAVLLAVGPGDRLDVLAVRGASSSKDHPYSESIVRYTLDSRLGALFLDAQADRRIGDAPSVIADAIRCSMCAPLIIDDQILGALYVDNLLAACVFTPSDLDLLTGFANQAALALHAAALRERLQQSAIRQHTLERFFPPATVARIMETDGDLGITELFVTALFSDISAFTTLSATMAPSEVVRLLHAYFPRMAAIVFEKEGTLEKYIGDALMAVWGAPFAHGDDADRALEAAVAMQEAVTRLSEELPHPLAIHIGLHSGTVALANIGSADYLQVATIGDATNTAARVCTVAREAEIVITRATADRLLRPAFPLVPLPPTRVKGKAEPLDLLRVDWRRRGTA